VNLNQIHTGFTQNCGSMGLLNTSSLVAWRDPIRTQSGVSVLAGPPSPSNIQCYSASFLTVARPERIGRSGPGDGLRRGHAKLPPGPILSLAQ
jgi:hypothetical protein